MSKTVNDFLNFGVGDMITLSDIQTQHEYDDLSADFRIHEVRTYKEPNDTFKYTCYICKYAVKDTDKLVMVRVRQVGSDYDLFVYYLDQEGDVVDFAEHLIFKVNSTEEETEELEEDQDEVLVVDDVLVDDFVEGGEETDEEDECDEDDSVDEDLIGRFEIILNFDDPDVDGNTESDVTWDKNDDGSTFGVQMYSTESGEDIKTLAEYFTNDETCGNPHCFIEWTGDSKKGWIEMWYGCEIRPEDLEIFKAKRM